MEYQDRYLVSSDRDPILAQQINRVFREFDERLNEIEYKGAKGGKKSDISRAEKSAILYELGIMDHLLSLGISQGKIAELLSLIFNSSKGNIEKDLSQRSSLKAPFKKKETYKFLIKKFNELGLEDLEKKSQDTLNRLEE
jgi:hypothetical protein